MKSRLVLIACGFCLLVLIDASAAKPSKESTKNAAAAAAASVPAPTDARPNAEFPEEDSDMLMEPNDFAPITVLRSHEPRYHVSAPLDQFRPIVNPQISARIDAAAPLATLAIDSHTQAAQNYYPPFFREAPPLGHSRPYFATGGEGPPLAKYAEHIVAAPPPQLPLPQHQQHQQQQQQQQQHQQQQQQQQHPHQQHQQQRSFDPSILGSGDFGVLRGGTFYPEEEMPYHPEDNSDFNQFYGDANNGHGRPSGDGFIQKYTYPEEQFADFRDFADINTPADSAFSQFVVVYAAKNATKASNHPRPKNIFEQLELLDREKELEEQQLKKKERNTSKSKSKLAKTKLQKKYRKKTNPKDLDYEPLLALS